MRERKIVDYYILVSSNATWLSMSVNAYIDAGCQPYFEPTIYIDDNGAVYNQVMVKYEEAK